jgi:hypothetical protein
MCGDFGKLACRPKIAIIMDPDINSNIFNFLWDAVRTRKLVMAMLIFCRIRNRLSKLFYVCQVRAWGTNQKVNLIVKILLTKLINAIVKCGPK